MSDFEKLTKAELIERLKALTAEREAAADADEMQRLAHDLQVYRTEMEMQNQELREAQRRLEETRDRYADLYDFAPVGYLTLDAKGCIREINLTGAMLLGRERAQLLGKPFGLWLDSEEKVRFSRHLQQVFAAQDRVATDLGIRNGNGELRDISLESVAIKAGTGEIGSCRTVLVDISERKQQERIEYLAHFDVLTGLPNRSLLLDRLTQALSTAQRHATQVAVLFLDLDHFKDVNDTLGHAAGDLLLQAVAHRLRRCVRKVDTVARVGGDEFVLVLPDVSSAEQAAVVAENVMWSMSESFVIEGHPLRVLASVGISIYPDDGADIDTLLKNADAAMYHAKNSGRNNYQFFTEDMNARALEAMAMENRLRYALEHGELKLFYQPQVELASGRIVGAEALLRWHHPERGWLAAAKFLPVAEERGLIVQIGEWALGAACIQNRAWQDAGLQPITVAVNISRLQIQRCSLPDMVQRALQESGLAPQYLELELNEEIHMRDPKAMATMLQELQGMGIGLALDGFGEGHTSLRNLWRFPIETLKIDPSFIKDVTTNPGTAAITAAIIRMAKDTQHRVVVEGVETAEQLAFLRSHQCDVIQGHIFSEPRVAEEVAQLLRQGRRLGQ
jgi:diguanylate cyclase (GGDEF)-like protein/PAS domain S-box-containing protein